MKRKVWIVVALGVVGLAYSAWQAVSAWFEPVSEVPWTIQVDPTSGDWHSDDSLDLDLVKRALELRGWKALPGLYIFSGAETGGDVARRIASGERQTVRVVLPAHRDVGVIAASLAKDMWIDSTVADAILRPDSMWWQIRPNTYEFYWEASGLQVQQRLLRESADWWNAERLAQAAAWGLQPHEVVTLASIVQEETSQLIEAKTVAGLYLNRVRRGMKLQADPTLKFALGDWDRRRLLDQDLLVESPHNTYLHVGIPPSPIRIPESAYVDAVLQAETHDYLYMCARADQSGRHAFARSYAEHLRNARAYHNMLDRNEIYR
jgi:UPF0755 protein